MTFRFVVVPVPVIRALVVAGPTGPPGANATALLAQIDLATGITAAQRVAGAVPILNAAETALIWSDFVP